MNLNLMIFLLLLNQSYLFTMVQGLCNFHAKVHART